MGTSVSSSFKWAVDQARSIDRFPPTTLHSLHGDRDEWGHAGDSMRGLPFSRSFLSYLDGRLGESHLADAVREIQAGASGRVEKVGAGILRMVVAGETDPEAVRQRMRLRRGEWATASYWALGAFRRAVEHPQRRADLIQANDDLSLRQRMMRDRRASVSTRSTTAR